MGSKHVLLVPWTSFVSSMKLIKLGRVMKFLCYWVVENMNFQVTIYLKGLGTLLVSYILTNEYKLGKSCRLNTMLSQLRMLIE